METGLTLSDFEELEPEDLEALGRAVEDKQRRRQRRDANFYALLCNLLGGGNRSWKAEDFLPEEVDSNIDPAEAQAVLAAYDEMVRKGAG